MSIYLIDVELEINSYIRYRVNEPEIVRYAIDDGTNAFTRFIDILINNQIKQVIWHIKKQ